MSKDPIHLRPSRKEIKEGRLSLQNIERALYALHFDGLVVLDDAVDHAHLDGLNKVKVKDAAYLQGLGDAGPYNYHKGEHSDFPY
jgi:hypothetical protein